MSIESGMPLTAVAFRFRATEEEVREALDMASGDASGRFVPWSSLHAVCQELRRGHANDELVEMARRVSRRAGSHRLPRTYRSRLVSTRHRDGTPGRFAEYVGHECVLAVHESPLPRHGGLKFLFDIDDPYFPDELLGIDCGRIVEGEGFTSVVTTLTIFRFEHLYQFRYYG